MPTYEYRCESCGHTFDAVQGFADEPLTTCNVCAGQLRKVFSAVGIVFKGSGFYKTDSRGKGTSRGTSKPAESGGGEQSASAAASSESSSSESSSSESSSSESSSSKSSSSDGASSGTGAKGASTPSASPTPSPAA